jgi:hypothetical protein
MSLILNTASTQQTRTTVRYAIHFPTQLCLYVLLALIAVVLLGRAASKPFWFDEIITLRIAQCHFGSQMWHAITAGIDFTPPAIHVATRLSELAFGRGPISSRLPSIVSGLLVLLCGFHVSGRRGGVTAGFWALFLLCFSQASKYFIEARGYGLVMAGAMVAWVAWQDLVDKTGQRWIRLLGVWAGLTLALASHMWAIVIPACFLASAMVNWLREKRVDLAAVAAIIGPYTLVLIYGPIITATRGIRFAGSVYTGTSLLEAYASVLKYVPVFLVACGVLFAAASSIRMGKGGDRDSLHPNQMPLEDAVLALCLVCAPAGIYLVARLAHTAFMTRYALVAVLGCTFLLAQLLAFLAARSRIASYTLLIALGLGLSAYSIHSAVKGWTVQNPLGPELRLISHEPHNAELVVYSSGVDFLQADYYAPPDMANRLAYVADRNLAKQFVGSDGVDSAYVLGSQYLHVRGLIIPYSELQRAHPSFWLVTDSTYPLNWLSEKLRADGAKIEPLDIPHTRISHVTFPAATQTPSQ